jgi:hypothetical protein
MRPMFDDLCYKTAIRDFDVELCLNAHLPPYYQKIQKSAAPIPKEYTYEKWYWAISKVRIQSARNEDLAAPIPQTIDGRINYEERRKYFEEREPAYQQAAWEMLDRAVRFFKYHLHNPNLSSVNQFDRDFQNPVWIDEGGEEIKYTDTGRITVVNTKPHLDRFGIRPFSRLDDTDLLNALENPISPDLIEQLLSDAQSAAFQGNLRRSVLETAIACEIAVKQAFFAKATPSGAAYEYLEDKGKVHVSIPDLIHSVAKQAFGKSFKEDEEPHYNNIDFLFRGRNKVAHRGKLIYRDGSGALHPIDNYKLEEWWKSVRILHAWLLAQVKEQETNNLLRK